jgi:diguanylate cyclase (GGDEF)-like protein
MGHQAGDAILQHVATAIRQQIRGTDFAARIGGDEFAIILPETGAEDAAAAAERIIAAAFRRGYGAVARASVSAGSAPIGGALLPADVITRADVALYAAKRSGGNCHVASTITPPEQIAAAPAGA